MARCSKRRSTLASRILMLTEECTEPTIYLCSFEGRLVEFDEDTFSSIRGFCDVAVLGGGRGLTNILVTTLMDSETYSSESSPKALSLEMSFIPINVSDDVFKVVEVFGGDEGAPKA